jgi:deoxyribonuclease IV
VSELPLGAHQSIAGGTPQAVRRAVETGCAVLQLFVKNSNRWVGKPIGDEEAAEFRGAAGQAGLQCLVAHSSYLINPAGENTDLREKSIDALAEELSRCDSLGVPALVLHPGSRGGSSIGEGLSRVATCLDAAFERRETRATVLLETAAGQGAAVGASFEELRDILGESRHPERLGICLDTCHVFAAGYDLRTPESFSQTLDNFDSAIGLDRLRAIHVNDSKKDLGSRVDRHEHIGEGKIGEAGFRLVMTEPRLRSVPKYLETPKDPDLDWDRKNLATLRRLAAGG